jgi:tRNA modification GTPase
MYDAATPHPMGESATALFHDGVASKTTKTITVVNKIDVAQPDLSRWSQESLLISVKTGHGLRALRTALVRFAEESFGGSETPLITRVRHRQQIEHARSALNQFLGCAEASEHPEIAAEHLRAAADALGRLTGRLDVEDVLGQIFSEFCIGK